MSRETVQIVVQIILKNVKYRTMMSNLLALSSGEDPSVE